MLSPWLGAARMQLDQLKRREFITLLGGAAAVWPLAARAQQTRLCDVSGCSLPGPADDPDGQARLGALQQGLPESGWGIGGNVRIDMRWSATGAAASFAETPRNWSRLHRTSSWPLAPRPCGRCTRPPARCRSCSRVGDPVGGGLVESLARPGGNVTGFMSVEFKFGWEMAGAAQGDHARQ